MTAPAATSARRATREQIAALEPLRALSANRLREIAEVGVLEHGARGGDPLAARLGPGRTVFLLRGELLLMFKGGGTEIVVGGHGEARYPLSRRAGRIQRARAITEVDLLAIDDEVLDILMTFDQMAATGTGGGDTKMGRALRTGSRLATGVFSLSNLRHGVFARLPPARIEELLRHFERITAATGSEVIREGEEGDYYYVIVSGRCRVERIVGGVKVNVAELSRGDAFGEEALVSGGRRNATVSMLADGELLRLGKEQFGALLREPLLQRLSYAEGRQRVAAGAVWMDVRYPSEYRFDHLPGAVNVPLSEVRNSFPVLDPGREYIAYCQSGRRSSAAAFLLAQHGLRVALLEGGLNAARGAIA